MGQSELWTRSALVVEDDDVVARLLQFILQGERYVVQRVADGAGALTLIEHEVAPDLVTLDYMLPDMTGIDLLRTMRSSPDWKHVPVLLLSAETRELVELAAPADGGGTIAFMEKPFRAAELRAYISRFMNETALHHVRGGATPRRAAAGRRY